MLPTARRLVQLTGWILRFAVATGRAKHNTAADLDGALQTSKTVHRASIIDPKNVGKLLFNIENYDCCLYLPIRYALRLMPYVFVCSKELCNAEWSEIDFSVSEWHISAQRMKMGDKQRVCLCGHPQGRLTHFLHKLFVYEKNFLLKHQASLLPHPCRFYRFETVHTRLENVL